MNRYLRQINHKTKQISNRNSTLLRVRGVFLHRSFPSALPAVCPHLYVSVLYNICLPLPKFLCQTICCLLVSVQHASQNQYPSLRHFTYLLLFLFMPSAFPVNFRLFLSNPFHIIPLQHGWSSAHGCDGQPFQPQI